MTVDKAVISRYRCCEIYSKTNKKWDLKHENDELKPIIHKDGNNSLIIGWLSTNRWTIE
jgi:hypothetical protein